MNDAQSTSLLEESARPYHEGSEKPQIHIPRPGVWVSLCLVVLILLVYGQVYHFQFSFLDDNLYITNNPRILKGLSWDSVKYAFTSWDDGSYLPLIWLSHAACVSMFGLNAGGHHLVNLAFHIGNSVLWFFLLRSLTKSLWPSAVVALLFALHPLHVESVAWIAERKDVISTFLWLLTVFAYTAYIKRPSPLKYLRLILFFILGLLSKSMLVTLPLTLILLDIWPLRRIEFFGNSTRLIYIKLKKSIIEKWPLFILSALCGILTILASKSIDALAIQGKGSHPLFLRIGNALVAMAKYIQLTTWPMDLSPYYTHPGSRLSGWTVVFSLLLLLCITVTCILQVRKRPFLLVGWLWFVITLLPVIGILQVGMQAYADRYTYVPLTGLFIMLAWLGQDAANRWRIPRMVFLAIPATILGLMISLTAAQIHLWRDSQTLFAHALTINPDNGMAHLILGDIYRREGRYQDALDAYSKANKNMPGVQRILLKMGALLHQMGQDEEAVIYLRTAHARRPEHLFADQLLGSVLVSMGRFDEAEPSVLRVLKGTARHAPRVRQSELAMIHASQIDWGIILRARNRHLDAIQAMEIVLAEAPEFWLAHMELGITLSEMGRHEEALAHLYGALASDAKNPVVLDALGVALFNSGRLEDARKTFEKMQKLDPRVFSPETRIQILNGLKSKPPLGSAKGRVVK